MILINDKATMALEAVISFPVSMYTPNIDRKGELQSVQRLMSLVQK